MEVLCAHCGAYSKIERIFCLRCRRRIIPLTPYDITINDFIHPQDQENLEVLKGSPLLSFAVKQAVINRQSKKMREWLRRNAIRVKPLSKIDTLIRNCGEILAIHMLPETYIIPSKDVNAFTFGSDDNPTMALTSAMLKVLNEQELRAVIGHELAHIKSKHLIYHTLAESLARGAGMLASFIGSGLLSLTIELPIRMLLLAWHRESEISADRASLLVVKDPTVIESLMRKLMQHSRESEDPLEEDEIDEYFKTHPNYGRRIKEVRKFYNSRKYSEAMAKLEKRLEIAAALAPACKFCGEPKHWLDIFCQKCGKSQL